MAWNDSSELLAWRNMIYRCESPRHRAYQYYGGRGIAVYDEWRQDFTAFLGHIGPRPSPDYSLDRIDNDGDYRPGNVRWATRSEQRRNRPWQRFPVVRRRPPTS